MTQEKQLKNTQKIKIKWDREKIVPENLEGEKNDEFKW